jgi:hypothetical protein
VHDLRLKAREHVTEWIGQMTAKLDGKNVRARCPDCGGAVTTFEHKKDHNHAHGAITNAEKGSANNSPYEHVHYNLLRCAGCGRGALSRTSHTNPEHLLDFYPHSIEQLDIPAAVPDDLRKELREAELCASVRAWRGAAALLRSTLEKTLEASGYDNKVGSLQKRIDAAVTDGVITETRGKRAHDEVRVLGNDVLHDAWRPITDVEYDLAHRYAQRILEDLYDDRPAVEKILRAKKRIP